jgi:hypothetical protein
MIQADSRSTIVHLCAGIAASNLVPPDGQWSSKRLSALTAPLLLLGVAALTAAAIQPIQPLPRAADGLLSAPWNQRIARRSGVRRRLYLEPEESNDEAS